jgi:L-lactate dehydrogenase
LNEKRISSKVVIVGAGFVGSTLCYSLLIQGTASHVVMIDIDMKMVEGEVMDLNHGLPYAHPVRITSGNYSDCKDADIVVIAVDKGGVIKKSRLELAEGNFAILKQIIHEIVRYNKKCILLVVTNPLDVMTYAALKLSRFPTNRVIGSGTILDSARLRYLVGNDLHVDPRNVHAYIIGEHGDSEVPVWSLANVAGIRLKDYCPLSKIPYNAKHFHELFLQVKNAAYEIIKRKNRTYYAVALGLTKIIESILRDENAVLTVSCYLQDYHGVKDICLSVPAVVNRQGIREIIKLPLSAKEMTDFRKSAAIVKEVANSLGL